MKKSLYFMLLLMSTVALSSCSKDVPTDSGPSGMIPLLPETKVEEDYSAAYLERYQVHPVSARFYAASLEPEKAIQSEDFIVHEGDTLLSLFNYEGGGWVIISSDKRTDPVLASRPTGELTFEGNENGALRMV
ncbi:MAG: Spi family protease inhibitor, partial [Bacteroidales bacterium]|nr:Spi family protease inhibitor [Bacteroidales bacterium]